MQIRLKILSNFILFYSLQIASTASRKLLQVSINLILSILLYVYYIKLRSKKDQGIYIRFE